MANLQPTPLFGPPVEEDLTPTPLFGDTPPPSERYDANSNSVVTTPNNFSDPSVSRESMEFIEGQRGEQIYGGTNYLGFADFAEAEDIKKILGGISPIVGGVTGKIERKIELGQARRPLRPGSSQEDIEAFNEAIPVFLSGLVDLIIPGQKKAGFQKMMEGVANFRQFAPFSLGFMSDERGLSPIEAMVQDNPEKAARLQAASKKARENTDEFLIEHGVMFGPDDEPTLVGTILQQASLTGSIAAVGMVSRSPALVMGVGFGSIQQGEGFLEAREAGKDVFEAATIGDIQGGIEFAMSSIEMGMVMKIVDNKSAGIAKKIAAGFVGEAAQESITDTFLLAVSNLAGVKNMTLEQALQAVIQAGFYGGFAGGITTGGIGSVQRIAQKIQDSIDAEVGLIDDPADVPDRTGQPLFDFLQVLEEAVAELEDEVSEQYISDIEVENQVDEDKVGGKVTKSAQSKGESQAKVADLLKKIESGEEFNVQEEFDKLEPEARKKRERQRLAESRARKVVEPEALVVPDTPKQSKKRSESIKKKISNIAGKKKAELSADHQNAIDSLNKIRTSVEGARNVRGELRAPQVEPGTVQIKIEGVEELPRTEAQKKADKKTRDIQVRDANQKITKRLMKDMDEGIPNEGLMLQVRYFAMIQKGAKVSPEEVVNFEADLNAFIATGLGKATAADAIKQAKLDSDIEKLMSDPIQDNRASIENDTVVAIDASFDWWAKTLDTKIKVAGMSDTVLDFNDAAIAFSARRIEENKKRNALLQDVAGEQWVHYLDELENSKTKVIDVVREGNTAITGGNQSKRMKLTRGEMVYFWMLLQEPSIKNQIMNPDGAMGWTEEFVVHIEDKMTDQDKDFANGMFEIYEESYAEFNEVYRRLNNRDLPKVEHYSNIVREGDEHIEGSVHGQSVLLSEIIDKESEKSDLFPSVPAETKERKIDASREIKVGNVINSHRKYTWDVQHYIAYAEQIRLANKLLLDKDAVKTLKFIFSEGGYRNLIEHLKIEARSVRSAAKVDKMFSKIAEGLRRNTFKGALLLNPKLGLGQTASVIAWKAMPGAEMTSEELAEGVADFTANPKKWNDLLNEHSVFKDRSLNFSPEIEQLGKVGTVFDLMALPSRLGDGYGARAGAVPAYKKLRSKGLSHKEALNKVALFASRSQQSTLTTQKTLAQKSDDTVVRTMTMFRSSLVAMMNVSMQSISDYKQADRSTPEKEAVEKKKLVESIAIQNVVIPALYSLLTGRGLKTTILMGSLPAIPVVSEMLEVVITVALNAINGEDDEDDRIFLEGPVSNIPFGEAAVAIKRGLTKAPKLTRKELWSDIVDAVMHPIENEEFIRGVANSVDILTPIPEGNIIDLFEGAMKIFLTDDPVDAALQLGGFTESQRKTTIKRLDAVLPGDQSGEKQKSGTITQPLGAF